MKTLFSYSNVLNFNSGILSLVFWKISIRKKNIFNFLTKYPCNSKKWAPTFSQISFAFNKMRCPYWKYSPLKVFWKLVEITQKSNKYKIFYNSLVSWISLLIISIFWFKSAFISFYYHKNIFINTLYDRNLPKLLSDHKANRTFYQM